MASFLHNFRRTPSHTLIDVEPLDRFSHINQPSLAKLVKERNFNLLRRLGWVEGVAEALQVKANDGIYGDDEDVATRSKAFGSYKFPNLPSKSFFRFVLEASKDPMILILLVCAVISVGLGIKSPGPNDGWYDGGNKLVALVLVITIFSGSMFWPDSQFRKLSQANTGIKVDVVRNRLWQQISLSKIVVGDVVFLKPGDQVPADGLFLDGQLLRVDESDMTQQSSAVEVDILGNPFLLSGTKVADGYARMLVTAVGMNPRSEIMSAVLSCDSFEQTFLQVRLKYLTSLIGQAGVQVALVVLLVRLVPFFAGIHQALDALVGILATPIMIASTAAPEGLTLAVTITLAYSMKKLMEDQVLVKKTSFCHTIGSVTTICTSKTGNLTLDQMVVTKFWLGLDSIEKGDFHFIEPHVFQLLLEGIALNTTQPPSKSLPEISWNPTEKAICNWATQQMEMDIEEVRTRCTILQAEAFNSKRRQSGVLIKTKATDTIHVHRKGAPEVILDMCSHYYGTDGRIKFISGVAKMRLESIIKGMAAIGLRCIAFAHGERWEEDYDDGKLDKMLKEGHLTLLGIVGLQNPCRPGVREAMEILGKAGVNVKMITGDNIFTARAIAAECGILKAAREGEVVEGAEFLKYSAIEKMERVDKIRVMARASPFHKFLVVQYLKEQDQVVAVAGHSTADARALREADVGLCLGSQASAVAKESSDIVILNDHFASVPKVLRWDRGIHDNIQLVTQFQLTATIVSLVIDSVTAISAGEPATHFIAVVSDGKIPYPVLQLLWVKLIMGTVAAVALILKKPPKLLLPKAPMGRTDTLVTHIMRRNIMAQALYQIVILLTIHLKGKLIFNAHAKVKDSLIFNSFILCQIFGIINAGDVDKNAFNDIQRKKLFWGIMGTIIVLQVVVVEFLKRLADIERLNWGQWATCIGIAAGSRLVDWLIK